MRRHIIISGTGRAGTTFLVELLSELGIETGRDRLGDVYSTRAGLEYDIAKDDAPYVVKDPHLSLTLGGILAQGKLAIDHAIVPVRDLKLAARSRVEADASVKVPWFKRLRRRLKKKASVPGGLWGVRFPSQQENALREVLSMLIVTLAEYDIPHTFIYFPRMVEDEEYLFSKLRVPFPTIDRSAFGTAFKRVADIKKVTVR